MTEEQINILKELKSLLDSGVITQQEFEIEKAKIMNTNGENISKQSVTTPTFVSQQAQQQLTANLPNDIQSTSKKSKNKGMEIAICIISLIFSFVLTIIILIAMEQKRILDRRNEAGNEITIKNAKIVDNGAILSKNKKYYFDCDVINPSEGGFKITIYVDFISGKNFTVNTFVYEYKTHVKEELDIAQNPGKIERISVTHEN